MPEGICFTGFLPFLFPHGHTLHVSVCVLFMCCFPSLILLFLAFVFVCLLVRHMKIEISYALEDGHVGRNM
jgi:hypothetical protein